jgi:hypothetical protein
MEKILLEAGLVDVPPPNMQAYITGLKKGTADKMFFLNHIKPDLIVDFGSADGFLLGEIHRLYPHIKLIGYDIATEMISRSRQSYPQIAFTNKWDKIPPIVKHFRNPCVLLSSVIHEVYSYSSPEAVEKFWNLLFDSGFEYIVIRDTIPPSKIEKVSGFEKDVEKVRKIVDPALLSDYENKWGPIDKDYKNFIRFILMYRYKENWARERLEDYLPLTYEALIAKITDKYRIIYDKSFKFKPIQQSFTKDFGVSLRGDTHLKMIIRKK